MTTSTGDEVLLLTTPDYGNHDSIQQIVKRLINEELAGEDAVVHYYQEGFSGIVTSSLWRWYLPYFEHRCTRILNLREEHRSGWIDYLPNWDLIWYHYGGDIRASLYLSAFEVE